MESKKKERKKGKEKRRIEKVRKKEKERECGRVKASWNLPNGCIVAREREREREREKEESWEDDGFSQTTMTRDNKQGRTTFTIWQLLHWNNSKLTGALWYFCRLYNIFWLIPGHLVFCVHFCFVHYVNNFFDIKNSKFSFKGLSQPVFLNSDVGSTNCNRRPAVAACSFYSSWIHLEICQWNLSFKLNGLLIESHLNSRRCCPLFNY